jgi:uridine kinase
MSFSAEFPAFKNASRIIGITGGTGSGKTTFARAIHQYLDPECAVLLHIDDYYRDCSHLPVPARQQVNFDHPDACDTPLLIAHLHALKNGHAINAPRYDFATHTRLTETVRVPAKAVILLEGLLAFANATVRNLLHLLVYVETPDDVRFIRRLRRDVLERGRTMESVVDQYLTTVRPMHQTFVEPIRTYAQVKISGETPLPIAVEAVVRHVGSVPASVDALHAGSGA